MRVVLVNTAVFVAAVLALVVTPLTVSSPVAAEQVLILVAGVGLMALANAALLRVSFRSLARLVHRMQTLDLLQPEARLPERGSREATILISGFNSMLDRLEGERRESTRRTLVALEGERRRIGLELHDEIGQRLTGTLLQLRRVHEDAPPGLKSQIEAVQEEQRAALDEVGALAWQLRPSVLDDLGLLSALDSLVCSYDEHPGCSIRAALPAKAMPLMAAEVELAVYRVAQEALTNAVRHAEASMISLSLAVDPEALRLEVTDNGRGSVLSEGPGTRGMRERALLVGGRLQVDADSVEGVRVKLTIPRSRLLG
jgi:two-component system sensor histidine kinase UhpB